MKNAAYLIASALVALAPLGGEALAKGKPEHAGGKNKGQVSAAGARHCPPGLAKKNPPCVPPGLAKKNGGGDRDYYIDDDRYLDDDYDYRDRRVTRIVDRYGRVIAVGDVFDDGYDQYIVLREPDRYGLPPLGRDEVYLQVGDAALRFDRTTQKVLTIIALADLLTR